MSEVREKRLTGKQRLFVEYYLGEANGNATEAARLAGYSNGTYDGLRAIAHETLTNPHVEAAISKRVAEAAMSANEVLARLASLAKGSLRPFVEVTPDGRWRTDLSQPAALENFHLLAELGYTEHGPKLKIHDPVQALVQIGRHHKLFTDKAELAGKDGEPLFGYDVIEPKPGDEPGAGEDRPE